VSGLDPAAPKPPTPAVHDEADRAKLRKAAHQLEGVFLSHLFKAMRETVPQDGEAPEGQAMFTSMLDDELAAKAADQLQRGLGEALYRQLSRQLPKKP
jgi:peptidoglycan hydrolase FlgJ